MLACPIARCSFAYPSETIQYNKPCCLDLFQHPSPFLNPIYWPTFGVFAQGALLSGLYLDRRYINLEIRYDAIPINASTSGNKQVTSRVPPCLSVGLKSTATNKLSGKSNFTPGQSQ